MDVFNVSNSERGELSRGALQMLSRELEPSSFLFQSRCAVMVYFKLSTQTGSLH